MALPSIGPGLLEANSGIDPSENDVRQNVAYQAEHDPNGQETEENGVISFQEGVVSKEAHPVDVAGFFDEEGSREDQSQGVSDAHADRDERIP